MLGNIIRDFGVKISLLFDKKRIEEARRSIDGVASDLKRMATEITVTSAGLLGFAAVSGANSRSLQLNSQQLGINVEKLQELEYAAKVAADVSREELTGALQGVSKTLFDARNNNVQAAQTLIRLGVPLSLITDKSVTADKILSTLADRFKTMPDGMYKTALATEAFGGAGAKLIPLLNKGSDGIAGMGKEARALGVILGTKTVNKGAEFDRQFTKIWIVMKNISNVIGSELIKYLIPMVMEFQKFIIENKKFISMGIAAVFKDQGLYLKLIFETIKILVVQFKEFADSVGGIEKVVRVFSILYGILTSLRILKVIFGLILSLKTIILWVVVLTAKMAALVAIVGALYGGFKNFFGNNETIKRWSDSFENSISDVVSAFKRKFPNITKTFLEMFASLQKEFPDISKWFNKIFNIVPFGLEKAKEIVYAIGEEFSKWESKLDVFSTLNDFGDWITNKKDEVGSYLSDKYNQFISGDLIPTAEAAVKASKNVAPKISSKIAQDNTAMMSSSGAYNNKNVTQGDIHMNSTVNFTIPPGASAESTSNHVSNGVQKGLHAVLRQTRDQFLGGVAQ